MSFRESETAQHQRAKNDIAAACQRAGYTTQFEAAGTGWRADVLAFPPAHPENKLAFEVQWSPLNFEDALMRQRRYQDDGVRGCWFFRTPPRQLQMGDHLYLRARRDLPLFHLFVNANGSFHVALNGGLHPLGAFVEALLKRRIRFCESVRTQTQQRLQVVFAPTICVGCGRTTHVYAVGVRLTGACGAYFRPDDQTLRSLALLPDVRAAAAKLALEENYRLGTFHEHDDGMIQFGCAWCGTAFAEDIVERALFTSGAAALALRRLDADSLHSLDIRIDPPLEGRAPHWCYPLNDGYCCKG